MIGSHRDALVDQRPCDTGPARFGGPLAILGLVLAAWVAGRAVLWENPFAPSPLMAQAAQFLAQSPPQPSLSKFDGLPQAEAMKPANSITPPIPLSPPAELGENQNPARLLGRGVPQFAMAHHSLWQSALTNNGRGTLWSTRRASFDQAARGQGNVPVFPGTPPFTAGKNEPANRVSSDRWSLSAWAFMRGGSTTPATTPGIAQGPAPIYGASQLGANLQYRLAPRNARDPRAYLRAARALINRPESEIAMGVSARPAAQVPVRVATEVRVTDNPFGRDVRPAAFAITEIPPITLPFKMTAEVYGAAGYVGGDADTGFAEGQTTVMRSLADFDLRRAQDIRLSVGGGAWGGAQRGAHRVDVGPTLRIDMALGEVPTRFSIDYRERIGGDAAPISGLAATLSAQF